jgi:hypothetical protein
MIAASQPGDSGDDDVGGANLAVKNSHFHNKPKTNHKLATFSSNLEHVQTQTEKTRWTLDLSNKGETRNET